MKVMLSALVSGALCCAMSAAPAQVLGPSQVASISSDNYNWGDQYLIFSWATGAPNVGLLQFDLSGVGTPQVKAKLDLFHELNAANGAVFALYANTAAWNSNIARWSDLPAHSSDPVAQLTIGDDGEGVWRSFDVTSTVNAWISGAMPNYGFTLARVDDPNPQVFFSSTAAFGGEAPRLTVTAVPEPSVVLMLALGLAAVAWRTQRRASQA